MTSELLDYIEINPENDPCATLIWLHGLGADGHDFEPIVPELRLPDTLAVRFIFPHAPERPVTINAGMVMRAWYDVLNMREMVLADIFESAGYLVGLIQNETQNGMPSDRIVLAGFSQGGALALHTGLRYEKRLGGILALSTYLPTADTLLKERNEANQEIPIMMAHGTMDPIIPIARAIRTRQELVRLGYDVRWDEYPMEHAICAEEIQHIRSWLLGILIQRNDALG